MYMHMRTLRVADGPDIVHLNTIVKEELREARGSDFGREVSGVNRNIEKYGLFDGLPEEKAQEKQAREEFEDKFLVTPIFLEGRKPMTAAKSVEELSTGEIAVFRQVFETLEKADAGDGGINGSIEAVELQRAQCRRC